jgi:beta-glucanase (GH16 family)
MGGIIDAKLFILLILVFFFLLSMYQIISPVTGIPVGDNALTDNGQVYELVWFDDFNESEINTSIWNFNIGNGCPNLCGWGNNELEYYKKENAFIENGSLVIEARREIVVDNVTGRVHFYTSARLDTIGKFKILYGRIEVRAKLPEGKGIWPAIWLLGEGWTLDNPGAWPGCGEIDIMEMVGHDPTTVYGTVHAPLCYGANGVGSYFRLPKGYKFSDDFHLFALEWTPNVIKWYVDGQLYHVVTRKEFSIKGCKWVFDHPFHLVLNVAVGGNWPGNPDESTKFPQRMIIDYIKLYKIKDIDAVEKPFNTIYDSDDEILARTRGWPDVSLETIINPDFREPIDKYNVEFKNPDNWFLVENKPDLINYDETGQRGDVVEITLNPSSSAPEDIQFGQYVWLYQDKTYCITIRAWSDKPRNIVFVIKLPSNPPKIYLSKTLRLASDPREYIVNYHHEKYAGNVVYLAFYLGGEINDKNRIYIDSVYLTKNGECVISNKTKTSTTSLTKTTTTTTTKQQTPIQQYTNTTTRKEEVPRYRIDWTIIIPTYIIGIVVLVLLYHLLKYRGK